jgi:hypothetical protein
LVPGLLVVEAKAFAIVPRIDEPRIDVMETKRNGVVGGYSGRMISVSWIRWLGTKCVLNIREDQLLVLLLMIDSELKRCAPGFAIVLTGLHEFEYLLRNILPIRQNVGQRRA